MDYTDSGFSRDNNYHGINRDDHGTPVRQKILGLLSPKSMVDAHLFVIAMPREIEGAWKTMP